jgi:ethanolamine utilization microcompartment shell protein EutS
MNRGQQIYDHILAEIIYPLMGYKVTTTEILNKFGKLLIGKAYLGAVPSDMIPIMKPGECCIVNTDDAKKPGEHWLGLSRIKGGYLLYDSFGRSHKKVLPKLKNVMDSLRDAEQNIADEDCGQRCIAFLCVAQKWSTDLAATI